MVAMTTVSIANMYIEDVCVCVCVCVPVRTAHMSPVETRVFKLGQCEGATCVRMKEFLC